jgi:hypothetical protein
VSSGGILFASDQSLPVGDFVELWIAWPVPLNETVRLQLMINGRVMRVSGNQVALEIRRYEFRTAGMVPLRN